MLEVCQEVYKNRRGRAGTKKNVFYTTIAEKSQAMTAKAMMGCLQMVQIPF